MFSIKLNKLFLCIVMNLITISCTSSNPASSGGLHTDANGFILEDQNGNEVYSEFEGAISGSISLIVEDTLKLSVHFLDDDENKIEHENEIDASDLAISDNNSDIAIIEAKGHETEHHEIVLHIIGISVGETSFKLELMHGNHADYTSTNNVAVTIINSTMISLY